MCEVSVRHVHLSEGHVRELFGRTELTKARDLSQPGQFLAIERVDLVTEKSIIRNVGIIGPSRGHTQVELSKTDCFALGLKNVPVRMSGDLGDAGDIILRTGDKEVKVKGGVIVAWRHVHLDPKTATEFGLIDGQVVSLEFDTERGGILNNAVVRVHPNYAPAAHIDTDEANALGFNQGGKSGIRILAAK